MDHKMDKFNGSFKCNNCNKYYSSYKSIWNHNKKFHSKVVNDSVNVVNDSVNVVNDSVNVVNDSVNVVNDSVNVVNDSVNVVNDSVNVVNDSVNVVNDSKNDSINVVNHKKYKCSFCKNIFNHRQGKHQHEKYVKIKT